MYHVGIEKIRRAVEEANEQKKVAAKQRDRVAPKMGRMDVDYQVLHDAFFKWQTKPPLSGPGADSVLLTCRGDGVFMRPRRRDAVDAADRESEPRQLRDGVVPRRAKLINGSGRWKPQTNLTYSKCLGNI